MGWGRAIFGILAILIAVVAILVGSFTSVIADEHEQYYDDNCGEVGLASTEECSEAFDIYLQFKMATNVSWGSGIVSVLVGLALLVTSRTKEGNTVYIQQPPPNNG